MSYSLGQAKWVPGQIHFATTRTGRLPSVQPLVEAGLPYAPYIEHGSWVTGQPDIARYGRDPYRGLSAPIGHLGAEDRVDRVQEDVSRAAQEAVRAVAQPFLLVSLGAVAGGAGGLLGGLLGKTFLGTAVGTLGGGALGFLAYKRVKS